MLGQDERVLVMTVGTGDRLRLEETLFAALRKSISDGEWTKVVLLPSTETELYARQLKNQVERVNIVIETLPRGWENDADQAYTHFDAVLAELLTSMSPSHIEVDFTRGTKAMSAGLLLAATRRAIPYARYVAGSRNNRGVVEAGTEHVLRVRTAAVDGDRRLDLARQLFEQGDFAAVPRVLPDAGSTETEYSSTLRETVLAVSAVSRFYAAWDRFRYAHAGTLVMPPCPTSDWQSVWPTKDMRDWVTELARQPDRQDHPGMAEWLRRVVVDLMANGERRIQSGQYEDALVRGYRILELVGQIRLFGYGLDSEDLDPKHPNVRELERTLKKKRSAPLRRNSNGKLQAARIQVARLLKRLGDPLAKKLLDFENNPNLKPRLRNNSILVHGFNARAPEDADPLRRLFKELEDVLQTDDSHFAVRIVVARGPTFAGQ